MKKILFVIALLATGAALADCSKSCNQQLLDQSKACADESYGTYPGCIAACENKGTAKTVTDECRADCDAKVNEAYTACSNQVKPQFDACINKCRKEQKQHKHKLLLL